MFVPVGAFVETVILGLGCCCWLLLLVELRVPVWHSCLLVHFLVFKYEMVPIIFLCEDRSRLGWTLFVVHKRLRRVFGYVELIGWRIETLSSILGGICRQVQWFIVVRVG